MRQVKHSFRLDGQLPTDVLPPETIQRLLNGGQPTPGELAIIRSAAMRDAGPLGHLLERMLSSGLVQETTESTTDAGSVEGPALDVPAGARLVEDSTRTFEWKWDGPKAEAELGRRPVTYYEAFTGKPDPARDFFVTSRRILNVILWVLTLGVPLALVALAIATGQSAESIFFIGVFGLIIGAMFRMSMPRTPFD